MNETIVKNILNGYGLEKSNLSYAQEDYIRLFLDGKLSQNQLMSYLSSTAQNL